MGAVKKALSNIDDQLRPLRKGAEEVQKGLIFAITSLPWADVYMFGAAAKTMRDSLARARGDYEDALTTIEHVARLARASAKILELRQRELGAAGAFRDASTEQVRSSSLDAFSAREFSAFTVRGRVISK